MSGLWIALGLLAVAQIGLALWNLRITRDEPTLAVRRFHSSYMVNVYADLTAEQAEAVQTAVMAALAASSKRGA